MEPLHIDVVALRARMEQRFRVYDVQQDEHVVAFYIDAPRETLENDFEALKQELRPDGLVPLLKFQGGEHAIYVLRRPLVAKRAWKMSLALFLLTLVTTTAAGALEAFSYYRRDVDLATISVPEYFRAAVQPQMLLLGFLTFALPLMLILGIHELGHYFMARRHGVNQSLPYFLPFPPGASLLNIGTMGAFIALREPMPNRKVLFDIGIAGPLAGLAVAIPVTLVGFALMAAAPVTVDADAPGTISIITPLLYDGLAAPFHLPDNALMHPTAYAGFVGFFLTAFNMLPVSQLDGGHVAYAMWADKAKYAAYAVLVFLVALGVAPFFGFRGAEHFLFPALLIGLLGVRHPPTLNGVSTIDTRRLVIGYATFALAVLCATPLLLE